MGEKNNHKWQVFRLKKRQALTQQFEKLYVRSSYMPSEAIFLVHHTNYWDAAVLLMLQKQHCLPALHLLVDETCLHDASILTESDVYRANLTDVDEALHAYQYADLLLTEGHSVALFPTTQLMHQERPVQLVPSIEVLTRLCRDIPIVPVTLYYTQRDAKRGEIWVTLGEPLYSDWESGNYYTVATLERICQQQLQRTRRDAIYEHTAHYHNIL